MTIGITTKRRNVALEDNRFPYRIFLSLLGVQRVTIKQRDNDFSQVFHILTHPSYCWISAPITFMSRNSSNLEIILDKADDVSIIVADHQSDIQAIFSILGITSRTSENSNCAFSIKETAQPITEIIGDGQAIGNPISFDAPLKRLPDIYVIDQAISFRNGLDASAGSSSDFRVTQASLEKISLSFTDYRINFTAINIGHLFFLNDYGSFLHYEQLYDKAKCMSNALQPKQEIGIPELVKRALMEDGWICRSTIIWHKPNPMPESVTDRPTKAHEYIFLMAKSEKYFYDNNAIREKTGNESSIKEYQNGKGKTQFKHDGKGDLVHGKVGSRNDFKPLTNPFGRNKRSVWTIAPHPFPGAHFATFPEKLVEPCIRAGTSEKGRCRNCGAQHIRVTEKNLVPTKKAAKHFVIDRRDFEGEEANDQGSKRQRDGHRPGWVRADKTLGWEPTCKCDAGTVPCVVLDPFCGAGTTCLVAKKLGRKYLGFDLQPKYCKMTEDRIEKSTA